MAYPRAGGSDEPKESAGVVALGVCIAFALGLALLWTANKEAIQKATYSLAKIEAAVGGVVGVTGGTRQKAGTLAQALRETNPYELGPGRVLDMLSASGRLLLPYSTVLLLGMAVFCWRRNVKQYNRQMNFETLLQEQAKHTPSIRPILSLRKELLEDDPLIGPWRYADDYWALSTNYQLLLDSANRLLPKGARPQVAWAVHESRSRALFAKQLGPSWVGIGAVHGYYRAIMAILLCFISVKRDEGYALIASLATSYRPPVKKGEGITLDMTGVEEAIQKYGRNPRALACFKAHAHLHSVLSAMLQTARDCSGVLATGEWRWLRPTNRSLHYALDQVGRRRAWPEAAGVRAHMLAEIKHGAVLVNPLVEMAVIALRQELSDEGLMAPAGPSFLPFQDAAGSPDDAAAKAASARDRFEGYMSGKGK